MRHALPTPIQTLAATTILGAGLLCVTALAQQSSPKPAEITSACANDACHPGIMDHRVLHAPTAQRQCLECHEYVSPEQHLFQLTAPRQNLCDSCHTMMHNAVLHTPVARKNCTGCHDPHGSDHRLMLVADPAGDLCLTCHQDDYLEKDFVHGPVAVGACVACHEPHSSGNENLLTLSPGKLCLDCHAEVMPTGVAARRLHSPMREGCTNCHDPHASDHRHQLVQDNPTLCFSCHAGVQNVVAHAAVPHAPTTEDDGCVQCHNPHFSPLPRLQKAIQPDLCLKCHNKELETGDGRLLANMASLLEENPSHHGPIREGNCTACHQPHGGQHFGLLLRQYPEKFYAPFEMNQYSLCFTCHLADMVRDESGTRLTGFRHADTNLHWLHVNREKGRTCRACHEVHASNRPFHIREAVPFGSGGWMLEINFEKTDTGGTCAPACHKPQIYDRNALIPPGGITSPTGPGVSP